MDYHVEKELEQGCHRPSDPYELASPQSIDFDTLSVNPSETYRNREDQVTAIT
jgi:hypothetical protein